MHVRHQPPTQKRRVIVAITGASGSIYGIRLLELMRPLPDVETHLILSRSGRLTLSAEHEGSVADVEALADVVHAVGNIGAPPSFGAFRMHGMLIAPCSVRTASNIAYGNTGELISRAADVMLKSRRTDRTIRAYCVARRRACTGHRARRGCQRGEVDA